MAVSCLTENGSTLATSLKVDKDQITVEAINGTETVNLTADGDWIAVAPAWITLDKKSGSGNASITIKAADNVDAYKELNGPRKEVVAFYGDNASAIVEVSQKGENGLNSTRTYSKITKADDFEAGKSYLLVFNVSNALQALKQLTIAPGAYSYMFTDEVEEADGIITLPNGEHGFTFVASGAEGSYAIQQANGSYLYQGGTYANFYIDSAFDKADFWTISFQEDQTVKLTNITNGDQTKTDGTKVLHFSESYGNVEARDGGAAPYPFLYKDSAAPTDEVLSVEDMAVVASATQASIPVTANKTWTVRNHDEWIKTFAKAADGKSIEVTFDANTSTEAARTATFTVIGETTNKVITLTQGKVMTTIAEVVSQIKSTSSGNPDEFEATLTNAVVSYVNGSSVYIEDASGAIKHYKSGHGMVAGNTITGKVAGKAYVRNGVPQITEFTTIPELGTGGTIPETEMTIENLLKDYDANISRRIILKGVAVIDPIASGDRNGKILQDGKEIALYDENKKVVLEKNALGDLIAYPSKYNSTKQLSVWESSDFTKTGTYTPPLTVDGDLSDWEDIDACASTGTSRIRSWKFATDANNLYFYLVMRKNRMRTEYGVTLAFDWDESGSLSADNLSGAEAVVVFQPFTNPTSGTPTCVNGAVTTAKVNGTEGTTVSINVYGVDPDTSATGDSADYILELSIPRSDIPGLPASGTAIKIGIGYEWYKTDFQSVTL